MGCALPRHDITAEEATSHNLDLYLGYSHVFLNKYIKVHNKNSDGMKVSEDQFSIIRQKLGIKPKDPDCTQQIMNFYARFKVDLAFYNSKKLVNLAVLLCCGPDDEKAQFFFKNYLMEGQEKLSLKQVNEMFNDLLEVPLLILMGIQVKDEVNKLTLADIRRFAIKLKSGKSSACRYIVETIMIEDTEIDESTFVKRIKIISEREFLTGNGIRKVLKRFAENS